MLHCLTAYFEVATGKQIAPSIGATRTEPDFVAHIAQTVATAPDDQWIFIINGSLSWINSIPINQNRSCAGLLRQSGKTCDLGEKAKFGILKSTDELRQRILEFIEYLNRTLAKPFKWTYKGRPLTV